jgi:hypothetical protein
LNKLPNFSVAGKDPSLKKIGEFYSFKIPKSHLHYFVVEKVH